MLVNCSYCGTELNRKPSRIAMYNRQYCNSSCKEKSESILFSGRNNPACKYSQINDFMFSDIDILKEEHAYFLGLIASDGHVRKKQITIKLNLKDIDILQKINKRLNINVDIKIVKEEFCELLISSKQICKDLCFILGIDYKNKSHKKSHYVKFPQGLSEENYRHFIRGFFDGDGHIMKKLDNHGIPECGFTTNSQDMRMGIYKKANIRGCVGDSRVKYSGRKMVAFLDYIYQDSTIHLDRKYNLYLKHKDYKPKHNMKNSIYLENLK